VQRLVRPNIHIRFFQYLITIYAAKTCGTNAAIVATINPIGLSSNECAPPLRVEYLPLNMKANGKTNVASPNPPPISQSSNAVIIGIYFLTVHFIRHLINRPINPMPKTIRPEIIKYTQMSVAISMCIYCLTSNIKVTGNAKPEDVDLSETFVALSRAATG
jgi:hypothetical protein